MIQKQIIHIIPYDGIGGVEIAARSLESGDYGGLRFKKYFLIRHEQARDEEYAAHGPTGALDRPRVYLRAVAHVLRNPPDLVIASLWRSAVVLLLVKLLRPRQKTVIFLHLSRDTHWVDRAANRLAMCVADEIWTDSEATLIERVPERFRSKGRVISFLLSKVSVPPNRAPKADFIFWGRLNSQKNLTRALDFFARVARGHPQARLRIIGPDGGQEKVLRQHVTELGLSDQVVFLGPMDRDDIVAEAADASFYLQTSEVEGMALSVLEAMQLGLVPIVTPVGEIARYCVDGQNAVLIRNDEDASKAVMGLLNDPDHYNRLSEAASAYWLNRPLYRDDVIAVGRELTGAEA